MASTAVISDIHLGSAASVDLLGRARFRAPLIEQLASVDRLVLLGDTLELRDRPLADAVEIARPFFADVGAALAGREVVLVPGNHDHRLLGHWIERDRNGSRGIELDEPVPSPHPCVELIDDALGPADLRLSYPGVWIRDDVYATHGHYLDSHVTLPTIERLSVALVDRIAGRPTGRRTGAHDYEQVHAPVYDLLFNLAQGVRTAAVDAEGKPPSMRVWELIGGASGRARTLRGRALGSAVLPATLSGLERAGFGRFRRDFSLAEIGRSGVEAMHVVVERLGIDAEHVIFGHIHRRGPLATDDGRSASDPVWERSGIQLHNSGNWLYVPAMMGRTSAESPFWPGTVILVGETGPPERVELLADAGHAELAGAA